LQQMMNNTPEKKVSAGLQNMVRAIIVAGAIFTALFLVLLIYNGYRQYVQNTGSATLITELKIELLADPENEQLIERIREVDRDYRADRLRRLDFSGLGSLMLLISAAVTIGARKWQAHLMKINPEPCTDNMEPFKRLGLTKGRVSLIVLASLITGLAMLLNQYTPSGYISALRAGAKGQPSYASYEELALNWHRFRGLEGAGLAPFTSIPERWDISTGEGIMWKTEIPLPGFNSPIVWQDRVFVSGADEKKRQVYCFDALTGAILWTGDVPGAPAGDRKIDVMEDTGFAASTMATDGKRVYAIFATGDLAAFDFKGRLVWHKNLGIPVSLYGYASSLEVYKDRVLVQYDQAGANDGKSKLYAFDGATGSMVWESKRDVPNSWTTPIVIKKGETFQLITVADPWVISYNPEDGKEIWRARSVKGDVGASPIVAGNLAIAIAPDLHNVAIKIDGSGDVSQTHIAWTNDDVGPTIISPVSDGSSVFYLDTYGTLYNVSLEDGKLIYEHDFNENINASPTLVEERMYVLTIDGTMFIGRAGENGFNVEASNPVGERCYATPAFMPGRIYIRGEEHLYCIGYEKP